jgi:hypothetical protein
MGREDLKLVSTSYWGWVGLGLEAMEGISSLESDELEEVYLLGVCPFMAVVRVGTGGGFERVRAAVSDPEPGAERGVWAGVSERGTEHAKADGWKNQG